MGFGVWGLGSERGLGSRVQGVFEGLGCLTWLASTTSCTAWELSKTPDLGVEDFWGFGFRALGFLV